MHQEMLLAVPLPHRYADPKYGLARNDDAGGFAATRTWRPKERSVLPIPASGGRARPQIRISAVKTPRAERSQHTCAGGAWNELSLGTTKKRRPFERRSE